MMIIDPILAQTQCDDCYIKLKTSNKILICIVVVCECARCFVVSEPDVSCRVEAGGKDGGRVCGGGMACWVLQCLTVKL